jgi:hypothetical protein
VVFARQVFFEGEKKGRIYLRGIKIVTIIGLAIKFFIECVLVYAIGCELAGIPPNYTLVGFSVILLPVIATGIILFLYGAVAFPTFFLALRLRKRVPSDDPHKSNLLYLLKSRCQINGSILQGKEKGG